METLVSHDNFSHIQTTLFLLFSRLHEKKNWEELLLITTHNSWILQALLE